MRFGFRKKTISKDEMPKEVKELEEGDEDSEFIYYPKKQIEQRFSILLPSKSKNPKLYNELLQELLKQEKNAQNNKNNAQFADQSLLFFTGSDVDLPDPVLKEFEENNIKFLRDTDQYFVFEFSPDSNQIDLSMDEGEANEQDKKIMERISSAIFGEIYINKNTNMFEKLRIGLNKSVKIEKGIKIKKMNTNIYLKPVTKDGPLLGYKTETALKIKILLFSIKIYETETISDIKIVD